MLKMNGLIPVSGLKLLGHTHVYVVYDVFNLRLASLHVPAVFSALLKPTGVKVCGLVTLVLHLHSSLINHSALCQSSRMSFLQEQEHFALTLWMF